MNKLVSKNPIQRFKLGNRIVKAAIGTYFERTERPKINTSKVKEESIGQYNRKVHNGKWTWGRYDNNGIFVPITKQITLDNGTILNTNGTKSSISIRKQAMQSPKVIERGYIDSNGKKTLIDGSNKKQFVKPTATVNTLPKNTVDDHYIGTVGNSNLYSQSATAAGATDRNSVAKLQRQWGIKDDGIWGKETQAAWEAYKNKLAADTGGTTGTTSNVTSTPTSTGATVSGNGYRFTLPTNTNTNANTNIYESYYPGTYHKLDNMFTRKGIRNNRGTNYSNVNEYWDWLQNNKDSEDYKVWNNIMGNDGYLNKEIFDNVMSQYGIRGNLGRRDSGRLSNLLNDLNLIGVQGRDKNGNIVMSDARKAFLTNFDRNLPSSEEINEYVRTNTPARPNLSTINWGLYPRTISSGNLFTNIDKSEYPHLFAKNGGLISKNPIKRFKSNFR